MQPLHLCQSVSAVSRLAMKGIELRTRVTQFIFSVPVIFTLALSSSRLRLPPSKGASQSSNAFGGEAPFDFRQRLCADGSGLRFVVSFLPIG